MKIYNSTPKAYRDSLRGDLMFKTKSKENRINPLVVHECYHYEGTGGGIDAGFAYTTLRISSKDKCKCEVCQKEFPIEFMHKMEMLVREYANAGCIEVEDAYIRLMNEARPVKYYLVGRKEVHYVDESSEKVD